MINRLCVRLMVVAGLMLGGCAAPEGDGVALEGRVQELDDMGTPPAGMELFLLAPGADVGAVRQLFERLEGTFVHHLPPRMVIGKVPAGADAVLRDSGVTARFARAVSPSELSGLDTREARFVRLFSSRYYPTTTPHLELVAPKRLVRAPDEPFETVPVVEAARAAAATITEDDDQAEQNERFVAVPYASGRVVVSVILPESNGRGAPDTETWTEESILEVYAKVQAGLEAVARHEPNARLDFVLHYESAPAPGGLEGTVDLDWEYGLVAGGAEYTNLAYAQLWSHIVGRELPEFEWWQAQQEYLTGLKQRYAADSAFIVYVGANQQFSASFRAYASINGPTTSLNSAYGYEVFAHEFGHIFGALDEYCPDQCISPSAMHGYLGMVNANATFRPGSWGGIRGGRGENQPSLMMANITNGVNGYTRGAFGWLDTDGDGILEVRDTLPRSALRAEVSGSEVTLTGRILDVPATSSGATPFSVNRISALHVRVRGQGSWVRIPVNGSRRGREDVSIALGALRPGHYELEVRGENSVGNLAPTPQVLGFDVAGSARNTRPLVSLASATPVLSTTATTTLTATTLDLDGDRVRVRFDLDGDGRYDTAFSNTHSVSFRPRRAGLATVGVQAEDARGSRAQAVLRLDVLDRNAPARTALAALPSPLVGATAQALVAQATARDPESGRVALNFKLERDDAARSLTRETGFGADTARRFDVSTPPALPVTVVDLATLDPSIDRFAFVSDAVRVGSHLIFALGELGVAVVDFTTPTAPVLAARLQLEVPAFDLELVGSTLLVLGEKISVVDVTNPAAPREVPQARATRQQRSSESSEPWAFGEDSQKPMPLFASFHEQIEHVRLELGLTHPAWNELRISLISPAGDSIVIWDHQARGRNQRSISVDDRRNEALRRLIGTRASGDFRVEIIDDVINGNAGEISTASLHFETVHHAFVPGIEKPSALVGSTRGRVVLSGAGLELVDVSRLDALRTLDRVETAYVQRAHVVGDRVLALTVEEAAEDKDGRPLQRHRLRGLFALDVASNSRLRELRRDIAVIGQSLNVVGTRFYVARGEREVATTGIGSLASFFQNRRYWLADSPLFLGGDLGGDDSSLWNTAGEFQRYDVSNPAAVTLVERFADPLVWSARYLDASTALALGGAGELSLVDLGSRTSVVSEVYRVTVQSRDASQAVSETTRSVHVVPYDHAPTITGARFVSGSTTRDPFELSVEVADADNRPSWDGYVAVRIDWEGDGIYDGPWQGVWAGAPASFVHSYAEGGDYQVRVQARDGFHALSNELIVPLHVTQYVPVPCTTAAECPSGEYCELGENSCGSQGVCERVRTDCYGQPDPVCACDGETYRNACDAQAAGVSVAHPGLCEGEVTRCGGPDDTACSVSGMFCSFPVGDSAEQSCGRNQGFGDCVYAPTSCFIMFETDKIGIPRPGRQVCGCDGVTYPSACAAASAGASVEFYGTCEGGPDCLQTGCAEGSSCVQCWGGPVCLPEGAHC
jgi:hypothetical protein